MAIEVPPWRPEGRASHYLKVRDRQSYGIRAGVGGGGGPRLTAGAFDLREGLAPGGVAQQALAPSPRRESGVAQRASLDNSDALKSAIAKVIADARPLAHRNGFKVELAQRVALRALQNEGARA